MKKCDNKYKFKEVLRPNSRKAYLVYHNTKTPLEYCWCTSKVMAKNICMLLNRQLEQSETLTFSVEEYMQCNEGQ